MNAQFSTQEQVEKLRNILIMNEYDPDNLTKKDLLAAIKEANFYGLYDAADFCYKLLEKDPHYKLEW